MLNTIWLATDLSDTAELPWAHALKLCATSGTDLTVYHVSAGTPSWKDFPTVQSLLHRWGILPQGATIEDFHRLGFRVYLKQLRAADPVSLLGAMAEFRAPDLLVMGSHRGAVPRGWLQGSIAEGVSRQTPKATLIVPDGCRPFVDPVHGSGSLRQVLVPVGDEQAQAAVDTAIALVACLDDGPVELTLLHLGSASDMPVLKLPDVDAITYRRLNVRKGPVVGTVVKQAVALGVDLIAMSTAGHDSWLDAVFGSRTERVLREAPCPVLVVPERSVR